jgi:dienelactone hydrolase
MKKLSMLIILLSLILFSCMEKQNEAAGLIEKQVEYTSNGTTMKGFLIYDENIKGKRPGILVVHEWWGLNDYARKRARMLAELGYTALAIDMYGDGKTADHPDDAGKFASEIMSNIETAQARFMAAYNLLKDHETIDPNNMAAVGYCFGGGVVLHMSRVGTELKAVASFHGGLQPVARAEPENVKAFVLVCNGADDPFITEEQISAFKTEMDSAGVSYEFINYPGSKHAFTNPEATENGEKFNLPIAYNEKADKESWEKMKLVFKRVFSE